MDRFVAHGQNWEDVRLRRVFRDRTTGLFIDVGAGHPSFHSFTYTLYRQGWRGVNVEPIPAFFALLEAERPEDVNLNVVLGREAGGTVTFYEAPEERGSSTMRPEVADQLRARGTAVVEHVVPVRTLSDICEEHVGDQTIDLLKVDVEGAEADVLSGADWGRFRPRLVVVERNAPETWEDRLLAHGYHFTAFDGVNSWYVEQAEDSWLELLEPPVSTLDNFVPFEILQELRSEAPAARRPIPSPALSAERPAMLLVLSSANQLYSGTGRVIFETLGRLLDVVDLEVVIDDADERNVALAREFCHRNGVVVHVGPARRMAGAPDTGNAELEDVLASRRWDLVLGVSWANAATNTMLLDHLGEAALAYLPLHQPSWTIPMDEHGREVVERVHRKMLARADVVLCISPWEQHAVTELADGPLPQCAVVPPGCDFEQFRPGAATRPAELLFVGDHREPRKRFDRVVAVLDHVRRRGVEATLLVVGNGSDRAAAAIPAHLAPAVRSLGYIDEEALPEVYRSAGVLLLLSEYEAFGLPVIEALASATPVVMTDQPAPRSLFGLEDGVHFVDGDDYEAVAAIVAELLENGAAERARLTERRGVLAAEYDWPIAARRVRDFLLAGWARHARHTGGAFTIATPGR